MRVATDTGLVKTKFGSSASVFKTLQEQSAAAGVSSVSKASKGPKTARVMKPAAALKL